MFLKISWTMRLHQNAWEEVGDRGMRGMQGKMSSRKLKKGKVFPYSLPSVGPGADPGVQAVSPQVT